ncbi:MAG: twin-arginine translocation signal domain-containing protein, partial [Chloroflexi bacterium]|nr:twin-arginine translocation signal domain-containing protein [Chloroflexota bacterium]
MLDRKIHRRSFVKLAAGTAGAVALGSRFRPISADAMARPSTAEGTWIPTCCNMCGGQTGVRCKVVEGRVVKIEPNPDNPIGVSNISSDFLANKREAAMCPKGNAGLMTLYDPDRLKTPLKRTNPQKGRDQDPQWKAISW